MRVRELHITYRPHPSGAHVDARTATSPKQAAALLMPMLEHQPTEVFLVILLNAKRKVMAVHEVARGGINSTQVDIRVVFAAALLAMAPAIILAHNHPSGDPQPSPDDLNLTQRIIQAGKILDIEILDHVIIGERTYCSFLETGRI